MVPTRGPTNPCRIHIVSKDLRLSFNCPGPPPRLPPIGELPMIRLMRWSLLLAFVLAVTGISVKAQYARYGGWGGWGGAGSTAQGSIASGMGNFAAGAGSYN